MTFGIKLTVLTTLLVVFQIGLVFSQKIEQVDLVAPTSSPEARELYNKGQVSSDKGDFKKSVKYYKEAISIDPNYIDAYDNLGLAFRQLGELDSAECYYKKSIEKYPKGTTARMNLGQTYTFKKDYDKALIAYQELTNIDSNYAEGYFGIARTYLAKRQFDSVIKYAKVALVIYTLSSHPYTGDALFLIGVSYYSKGDKTNAKKFLEEAFNFGFNVPQNLLTELGINKKSEKDRIKENKTFYENGNPKTVEYYDGFTPTGKWTEYYENGKMMKEYQYENGKPNGGCKYYYEDGRLWTERILKDGENWTVISNFDKNGNRVDSGTLKNGNGTMKLYNEQGELTSIVTYKNGIRTETKEVK